MLYNIINKQKHILIKFDVNDSIRVILGISC